MQIKKVERKKMKLMKTLLYHKPVMCLFAGWSLEVLNLLGARENVSRYCSLLLSTNLVQIGIKFFLFFYSVLFFSVSLHYADRGKY